jgi:molybdopterin molybdotransferase
MKTLEEALDHLLESVSPVTGSESIGLRAALGRVLANEVVSPLDVPSYDNSQMDGYAGVAVEMNNALEPLVVSQRIAAGHPGVALTPGTVARIFTGAPIPLGANAVVMQEQVQLHDDGRIQLLAPVAPGQNIRPRAGDLAAGQRLLKAGHRLQAADLGLAASVGIAELEVIRRLKVSVFSSGDELRQPGDSLGPGQIYDSNRPMIVGLVQSLGCEVFDMGCLPDQFDRTRDRLHEASERSDLVLTCGGVSVGEEDHIKAAISALGRLDLWKIAIKPGKPFAAGQIGRAVFMGMPGNPVAAWVTFMLLVRPAILKMMGGQSPALITKAVPSGFDWPKPDARQEYLRGWIDAQGCAQIHDRQNSGVLSSVTQSEGLIEIPASTPVRVGQTVCFIPYTSFY